MDLNDHLVLCMVRGLRANILVGLILNEMELTCIEILS